MNPVPSGLQKKKILPISYVTHGKINRVTYNVEQLFNIASQLALHFWPTKKQSQLSQGDSFTQISYQP